MDIDAGNPFCTKHVPVAGIIFERELKVKAVVTQVMHRTSLEGRHLCVIPTVAHDKKVPAQSVVVQPRESLRHHPKRPTGEKDYPQGGLEKSEQMGHVLDKRIFAASLEERVPILPSGFDEMLAPGGIGQNPVDVEDDRASRLDGIGAPVPVGVNLIEHTATGVRLRPGDDAIRSTTSRVSRHIPQRRSSRPQPRVRQLPGLSTDTVAFEATPILFLHSGLITCVEAGKGLDNGRIEGACLT